MIPWQNWNTTRLAACCLPRRCARSTPSSSPPVHFGFFAKLLERTGYHVAILNNGGRSVVDSGLKYVHNDACYPALLVIGQMIDAIQNGGYDPHKVALLITQTGGGCRGPPTTSTCSARGPGKGGGWTISPSSPSPLAWRRTPAFTGPWGSSAG